MSEIIEFPQKANLHWNMVEKAIRASLAKLNASEDMVEFVCSEMKGKFLKYFDLSYLKFTLDLPITLTQEEKYSINNSINDFTQKVHNRFNSTMGEVLLDILQLEIDLYNYKQKHSDGK